MAGYRASTQMSKISEEATRRLGHLINYKGVKATEDKVETLTEIEPPDNDKELKKKIKTGDMSIDAIAEAIHEHIKNQQNQVRRLGERKKGTIRPKETKSGRQRKPKNIQPRECMRREAPGWTELHDCPTKSKQCSNFNKTGHFSNVCRSRKNTNHVKDDEATSTAEDNNWLAQNIHLTKQTNNSTKARCGSGQPFYTTTLLLTKLTINNN